MEPVGFIPGPAVQANYGVSDILNGNLLAYAVSSAAVVVDVKSMQLVSILHATDSSAALTALCWLPNIFSRIKPGAHGEGHLHLATGDSQGRVLLWDVLSGTWRVLVAEHHERRSSDGGTRVPGGIRHMVWVSAGVGLLAIAMQPGTVCLLDPVSGNQIYRREWTESITAMARDPLDLSHLALCGDQGGVMVLHLVNPAAGRVESMQYRLGGSKEAWYPSGESSSPAVLSCMFAWTRELLFTMTQAQVAIFDMELHGLAASIPLPSRMANFQKLLAILPKSSDTGSPYGDGRPAGLDTLICAHADGVISLWSCAEGALLEYSLVASHSSLPSPPKSLSGTPLVLMSMSAALCRTPVGIREAAESKGPIAVCAVPPRSGRRGGREQANGLQPVPCQPSEVAGEAGVLAQKQELATGAPSPRESLILCILTTDGRIWKWDALTGTANSGADFGPPTRPLPLPRLTGFFPVLPRSVSTFTVCPTPVSVARGPSGTEGAKATVALAVVTGTGLVDIVSLRPGIGGKLVPVVSLTLEAHRDIIRGLRWLGRTPRLVSFSCKKEKHGWHNHILVTDMRTRKSFAFRDVGPEVSPMLAIRSSPSGRHLLILFRGAPSEIWVISDGALPQRVRVLDLPFTAVEWVLPSDAAHAPDTPSKWATWEAESPAMSPAKASPQAAASPNKEPAQLDPDSADGVPEEKLAFALGDGRTGVLSVRGRRISDTQPKRSSSQNPLAGGVDCVGMALTAWGTTIVLGDKDGNIMRWDTSTGRSSSIATGIAAVRKVQVAPSGALVPRVGAKPPSLSDPIARVAVLFSNGQWGVWELDARNGIRPVCLSSSLSPDSHHHHHSDSTGPARVTDLYWLPLPLPGGLGGVLAVAGEDASLSLVRIPEGLQCTASSFSTLGLGALPSPGAAGTPVSSAPSTPATARSTLEGAAFRAALALEAATDTSSPSGRFSALVPAPRTSTALLLPRPALSFLRLMLQIGVPLKALRAPNSATDRLALERCLWDLLPQSLLWRSAQFFADAPEAPDSELDIHLTRELSLAVREDFEPPSALAIPRPQADASKIEAVRVVRPPAGDNAPPAQSAGRLSIDSASEPGSSGRRVELLELISCLRALRGGELLADDEARAYEATLQDADTLEKGSGEDGLARARALTARMALVARVAGDPAEATFWEKLVPTLASLKRRNAEPGVSRRIATPEKVGGSHEGQEMEASEVGDDVGRVTSSNQSPSTATEDPPGSLPLRSSMQTPLLPSAALETDLLWSQEAVIQEARQRAEWHEKLSRGGAGSPATSLSPESLLAQQVLEYVMLGDFQTAVGFLLSTTPEQTSRYFRDALCTISLAAAASPGNASTSLHMQAAKVVAANAAAMGDTQLGVPLLCSVGLPAEAVTLLQDSGQWRHAATLAASQLSSAELSNALERWAMHVVAVEGCLWRGLGLLTAGGCCRTCVRTLKSHGYVECAAPYIELCKLMGAPLQDDARDAIFTPSPSPMRGLSLDMSTESADLDTTNQELMRYIDNSLVSLAEYIEASSAIA